MYFCPNTLTLFLACHSTARVGEMLIFETTNNKEEEEDIVYIVVVSVNAAAL